MTVEPPARRVEEATDAFDQLTALLERFEPLETVLPRLVDSAATVIPDTGSATVTILRADQARTASHPWAAELDDHQYSALDGACLEAARTGSLVRLQISEADRWPEYCRAARVQQVAVSVGAPLLIDEDIADTRAALNLTMPRPEAFDPPRRGPAGAVHPRLCRQPSTTPIAISTHARSPTRSAKLSTIATRSGRKRTSDGPSPLFRGGSVPTSSAGFPTRQHKTP